MNLRVAERCQALGKSPERATEMIGGMQSETCRQRPGAPRLSSSEEAEGRHGHNFQRCERAVGEERCNPSLCAQRG